MSLRPSPPESRPKRLLWRRFGYTVGTLLVLLGCILLFRQEIAATGARYYLEDQGVAVESLTVSALTTESLVLEKVQLGAAREASASRIEVAFTPTLLSFNSGRVTIDGLRLRLDLTGEGPMLGSLQPLIDAEEVTRESGASGALAFDSLPAMQLTDAKVIAETGAGAMAIDVDGELGSETGGDLIGRLSAQAEAEQGRLSAAIEARVSNDRAVSVKARIDEGRIDWQTIAIASLTGSIDFAMDAEVAPRITADLTLMDLNYSPADAPALNLADGQVTVSGDLSDFTLQASLEGPGESLLLNTRGAARFDADATEVILATEAEVSTSGGLAAYLPLAGETVAEGRATVVAEATASLPPESPRPESWRDFETLAQTAAGDFAGELILAEVSLREGSSGISAHLPVTAKLQGDALDIRLSDDAELRIETPSKRNLQDMGIPSDVLPLLTSGVSASLAAAGSQPFRLKLQPAWPPKEAAFKAGAELTSEQGVSLSLVLDGSAAMDELGVPAAMGGALSIEAALERFRLGDREARGISAKLPLTVALNSEGLSLALAAQGSIRLRQLSGDLPLRLNEPIRLVIDRATLEQEEGAARYRYRLGSRAASVNAELEPAAGEALKLELGQTALTLGGTFERAEGHAAEISAKIADISVPAYGLGIDALTASTRLDKNLRPVESRFAAKPVTLDAEPAGLAPLIVEGRLQRRGAGYDIDAVIGLLDRDLQLAEAGLRYDDAGTAEAKLRMAPLSFAPGGLQPADIAPALAVLENVEGEVSGEALLPWPQDAAAEHGRLGLRNLSFAIAGVRFQGLSLDLGLKSLLPLSSEAAQHLTIGRIDAGAPVEKIDLRFNLDQEPDPHLDITGGGFSLGGADWQLEPTKLDPTAAQNSVILATDNLDLATFFRLIEIEGLSGSGMLAGRIPVVFEDNSIVVEDGVLAAQGAGFLSIRSQALASALAGGGKTVELAIKALEDFRYDSLSVTLNKTAGNEAQVLLSILGSNPAVLDGQPFQFNINLESNLTSVLEALRQGYSLSDEALRRAWRLGD